MSYSPLNVNTFVAAMSGALSGIGIGERPITSTNPADYNGLALAAFAYAQEFDTLWGAEGPDTLEWSAIVTASQGYWLSRDKESQVPTHYTAECEAIIAAIREGDAIAIGEGIDIPAWPPSGGGGTVTAVTGVAPIASSGGTTPAISLDASGATPGEYGDATHVAQVTVNAEGLVTAVTSVPISSAGVGTVTDVTGTAPIVITGSPTATPNVTISPATDSTPGSLSAADKTKLDGLTGQVVVSGTAPIVITGSALAPDVTISAATDSTPGSMSAADKTKLDNITTIVTSVGTTSPIENTGSSTAPVIALANSGTPTGTFGDGTHVAQVTVDAQGIVTDVVAVPITAGGAGTVTDVTGTAPIVINGTPTSTPNVTISMASGTILIGQAGGGSPSAVTPSGDVTISDAGVVTLDTVNPDVGTFANATVTVNAKGLVTAVTAGTAPVTSVTVTAPIVNTGSALAPDIAIHFAEGALLVGQPGGGVPSAVTPSGDLTMSDAAVFTLDTVNSDVGTFGNATNSAQVTVNAKGLVTAVTNVPITSSGGTVTDVTGTAPIAVATGTTTPAISLTAPGYTYYTNTSATPIAITTVLSGITGVNTITPHVTGKCTMVVSGVVENSDSSATHLLTLVVETGAGAAITPDPILVRAQVSTQPGKESFAIVVALDQAPTNPVTFTPLGTPANISVAASTDANGHLTIAQYSIQFSCQERFA